MRNVAEVENIEEMRHAQGIEDSELWKQIAALHAGDFVRLTLMTSSRTCCETVMIRITSIRGQVYRGKLVNKPVSLGLSEFKAGRLLSFEASQIHSVVRERPIIGVKNPF